MATPKADAPESEDEARQREEWLAMVLQSARYPRPANERVPLLTKFSFYVYSTIVKIDDLIKKIDDTWATPTTT